MKNINSSKGFVLVAALIACVILSALSILVVTLSTGDLKTTVVILGGKKATASTESGYYVFTQSFDPLKCTFIANNFVTACTNLAFGGWQNVDAANIPGAQYRLIGVAKNNMPPIMEAGYPSDWGMVRYDAQLEGRDTTYNSKMQMDMGVAYGPVPLDQYQ